MKNEDDIHYFKNTNAFNQSLYSNPPDPSLGFMDNTTGSDMFAMLKKFLKNTEYLCGSMIVIIAKRYPNEVEIEDLISDLQKNHVFVYILSTDTPSGGSNPSAMFSVASRTNGYCVFSIEAWLSEIYTNSRSLTDFPSHIAAQKFIVSGKGSQTIPFKIPGNQGDVDYIHYIIVYQDHKPDGSLISLNYNITDEFGNTNSPFERLYLQFTARFDRFFLNKTVQYYLNIDYEYVEGRQEVMEVRKLSEFYIPDNWLPFNN